MNALNKYQPTRIHRSLRHTMYNLPAHVDL
jgi:hypothetical protein